MIKAVCKRMLFLYLLIYFFYSAFNFHVKNNFHVLSRPTYMYKFSLFFTNRYVMSLSRDPPASYRPYYNTRACRIEMAVNMRVE